MKNNNYGKLINKSFILMLALTIFICSAMLFLCNLEKNKVYADYDEIQSDPNSIVNFNQAIFNSYIHGSFGANQAINLASNLNVGNKYYIKFVCTDIGASANGLYFGNSAGTYLQLVGVIDAYTPRTIEQIVVPNYTYLNTYINSSASWSAILIDLTKMFGIGNEPNLEQCKSIFVAEYYAYTLGSPVSLSGLNSYAEGVASVYGNSVTLNPQYFFNNINEIRFNDVTGGYAKYINMNSQPNYSFNIDDHVIFSLPTTLIAGTNFKLSFYLGRSEYNDNTPLEIGYFIQGQFYSLTRLTATAQFDNYNYFELDLVAPYDLNGIVFSIPRDYELSDPNYQWYSVMVGDITLTYYITSLQQVISEAVQYGYEKYKDEVDSYYQVGGQGYLAIYNAGVRDSESNSAVFSDAWSFIGSAFSGIGEMLKVELFPNVPIGLFVAFPLLLGLIFFIVKLTKGGG